MARSIMFRARDEAFYFYPGESSWFVGGSSEFIENSVRLIDARTSFFYFATGITPAMAVKNVGGGSQYAAVTVDANRDYLDGAKNYRLHLSPNIPVKTFGSMIPYDTQTRSVLQTDQRDTAPSSDSGTVKSNADGSVDVYFGPKAPEGKGSNWYKQRPARCGADKETNWLPSPIGGDADPHARPRDRGTEVGSARLHCVV
jgi:hypothetical protein